jgi:SPP1 gp7 family putative phage head morphogenesis protein
MDLIAQKRIFDIVTRQAMFIEQVKADETQIFNAVLSEIEDVFKKELGRLNFQSLDGMSKSQLELFLRQLRVSQTRIYSRYQQALIVRLEQFMTATVRMSAISSASFAAHKFDEESEPDEEIKQLTFAQAATVIETESKKKEESSLFGLFWLVGTAAAMRLLWGRIKAQPMGANGILPLNYINTAVASSMLDLESLVRQEWANKTTVAEVLTKAIRGEEGKSSVAAKIRNKMRAVIHTTMQAIAQRAINTANSALWPEYVWVSIIDDRTSDICRSRHMNVYVYGKGPLPPAHPFCRSHVVPKPSGAYTFAVPSFFEWLKTQPLSFHKAVFGDTIAAKFENGTIKVTDFDKFKPEKTLSVAEFAKKTGDLL